jgi:hypothetical protein
VPKPSDQYGVTVDVDRAGSTDLDFEIEAPSYRVCFWRQPTPGQGANAWWYELSGVVNARQAVAWAEENARADQTYTIYAVFDLPWPGETPMEIATRRVMVRLFGIDPTKNPGDRELSWPGEIYT